jgi:hypothetical protein
MDTRGACTIQKGILIFLPNILDIELSVQCALQMGFKWLLITLNVLG